MDKDARGRLRTLSKDNAEVVGQHLIMAGRLIDTEPELAYEHAQEAVRRAGRVDIVREAAGLTAYRTERYAEALRELRTVRRLNGSSEHLAVMADCERGLGRPERALALVASDEAQTLDGEQKVELAIVASGARLDLGETDAAEAVLSRVAVPPGQRELALRVLAARHAVLEAAGRTAEADALLAGLAPHERAEVQGDEPEGDVVVFDLGDVTADGSPSADEGAGSGEDASSAAEGSSSASDETADA
ncbi:hypothetical protein JAV76_14785 [Sanguibacter sp. YZGR15]|uniref:Tetratricopeptide repeat protein n=2 Tax=Sanguibacter suaedae TaxID=2795737 RepID=A0A934M890_9MICO|nr:hypothetical protein [Sanguibacter suaedae]